MKMELDSNFKKKMLSLLKLGLLGFVSIFAAAIIMLFLDVSAFRKSAILYAIGGLYLLTIIIYLFIKRGEN